jgi:hypothetical protein
VNRFAAFVLAVVLTLLPRLAAGEGAATDEATLRTRLGPDLSASVIDVVHTAAAQGLPTAPLVACALEGASRQATPDAILQAVRRHASGLSSARHALGPYASAAELDAGAWALLAGVPEDSLANLRRARPAGSLVIPLVVMSDFVARGVPVENASSTVLSAARAGAGDPAMLRMRERIHQRILHGEAPLGASREGLRELLVKSGPGKSSDKKSGEPAERRRP